MNSTQAFYRMAYNKEPNDCSVRALAVTCAIAYDLAHVAMTSVGRRPEGPASMWQVRLAAAQLGFELHRVTARARTVRALCVDLKDEPGAYMAVTCDHVVGFWQGECIDWSRNRLLRIKEVYAILLRSNENEL